MARQHVEVQVKQEKRGAVIVGGLVMGHRMVGLSGRCWLLGKVLITMVVALIALLRWDAGAAFFLALLTASVTGLADRRVSVTLGLLSLASCPLLLILDREAWLQRSTIVNYYAANMGLYDPGAVVDAVAVWAYYFLCIGVVAQIAHYVATGKRRKNE